MTDEERTEIIIRDEGVQLGSMQLAGPEEVVGRATGIANELAKIIQDKKLFSVIQGKQFVRVEGWTTLGALLGVTPQEVSNSADDEGVYTAVVELVRVSDGRIVGRASAECGAPDEIDRSGQPTWATRARYARRSMAATRATGKAFRLAFSWIMALAGYEVTPWEEMQGVVDGDVKEVTKERQVKRPLDPKSLRSMLSRKADKEYAQAKGSDKQRNYVASLLGQCVDNDKNSRHAILKYLTGSSSTNDIAGKLVPTLIDWLNPDDKFNPDSMSCKEANWVLTAALKDQGQQELDIAKD